MKRKTILFLSLLVVMSMVLAACQPAATPTEEPMETPEPTEEPTEAPTEEPPNLDDLIAAAEESAAAAAASAEAAAAAAEQAPGDAAAVADLVAGYEPVDYPEVELETTPVERTSNPVAFPSAPNAARTGAWPDEVVLSEEPSSDAAVNRLETGDIDVYAYTVSDPEVAARIEASEVIDSYFSSGSYNELTFNPAGPEFEDGRLNPFAVARIREAMNYLIDREFLVEELLGGLGTPRWTAFNTAASDSAALAAEIRALEVKYAYNKEMANEIITEEMQALGAEMVDGVWNYNGEPVEIHMLIRIEDERLDIGDYVANQLEDLGFTTFRDYKSSADASPIWIGSNPAQGGFHIYTGGWVTTAVPRLLTDNFGFFYTPLGLPYPLWAAYEPSERFMEVSSLLYAYDYDTNEERLELGAEALRLSMEDSARLWLYDAGAINPKLTDVSVTADLYAGIAGSALWAQTLRRVDEFGAPVAEGTINIAMPSILTEPWNPIAGTNWVYDMMPIRGSGETALAFDPFTGLVWPQRAESAEVVVPTGTPMAVTHDWVDLLNADEIVAPGDAWASWDAEAQTFLTVPEYYTNLLNGLTAKAEADVAAAEEAAASAQEAADAAAAAAEDAAAATTVDGAQAAADAAAEAEANAADAESAATGAVERIAGYTDDFNEYSDILANGLSVKRLSTVTYPADLYDEVLWHDGSNFSFADVLMGMILTFDRAMPASAIYDPNYVPSFNSFMSTFGAVKVISTDPLVIETYSDATQPDAENSVSTWWPYYAQGQGAWHNLNLGVMAEAAGLTAFSQGKADNNEVDWMGFVAGETVEILNDQLVAWTEAGTLPYDPTFSQYVEQDELDARVANLAEFYDAYGHFWIGTGPLVVEAAFPIEKSIQMTRFEGYPDNSAKWLGFSEAKISELAIDGEARVTIGEEAVFDLQITFEGAPYPTDELNNVKYLVLDATNTVAKVGQAEPVTDGQWQITLTADDTAALAVGANSLEVVVVSNLVAVPTSGAFDFVTVE